VKIYRRSKDGVAPIAGRTDSTGTLGSTTAGRTSRSPPHAVSGVTPVSLAASNAKDYPELVRRQLRWDSSASDVRSSARASATSSPAPISFTGTQ